MAARGARHGGDVGSQTTVHVPAMPNPQLATAPVPPAAFAMLQPSLADYNTHLETLKSVVEILTNAAVDAAATGDDDTAKKMEEKLRELLKWQDVLKRERACIEQLRSQEQSMTLDAAQAKLNEAHAVQFTDADVKKLADYRSFREKVWTAGHPNEDMPADDVGDDDEDLVVRSSRKTYKCPITLTTLVTPMQNATCKHHYSQDAIMELLRKSKSGSVKCPVAGCGALVEQRSLKLDKNMEREVLRAQQSQATQPAVSTQVYEEVED